MRILAGLLAFGALLVFWAHRECRRYKLGIVQTDRFQARREALKWHNLFVFLVVSLLTCGAVWFACSLAFRSVQAS